MNLAEAQIGYRTPVQRITWSSADCLLYAVGIGAGTDELAFVTENSGIDQLVYPTFADTRVADLSSLWEPAGITDRSTVVHGNQTTEVFTPLAPDAEVEISAQLVDVRDRGKHAIVDISHDAVDPHTGELVYRCSQSLVLRGHGGFGGHRGADPATPLADVGDPDWTAESTTFPTQALVYRLNGDRNPLHSNPAFAQRVGFDRPILHGLCTYGIAARLALHTILDGDPARFRSFTARFSRPVFPGETLRADMWDLGDRRYGLRVTSSSGEIVLDDAVLTAA